MSSTVKQTPEQANAGYQSSTVLTLNDEEDSKRLAQKLATLDLTGSVWLSGDLGVGKTTLTRYWLHAMGHKGAVKSPTYTLVEPYEIVISDNSGAGKIGTDKSSDDGSQVIKKGRVIKKPVYHVDLYRLQDPEELEFIGFDEYQDNPNALLIIEWASRAKDNLAAPILKINISHVAGNEHARQVQMVQPDDTPTKNRIDLSIFANF